MFAATERKGPHKSMHCKFCKPPGVTAPEKATPAQLETKTKLHLSHEVADLKVFDVFDEPGVAAEESEACICQLEGYTPCPKCVPDKKRKPVRKKVCDCPPGSKPHPNITGLDTTNQKKKKKKVNDDEFWWEKYDREHDAIVKETWAAYLAQRKQEKKLIKCREKEGLNMNNLMRPRWYQKLSSQQTIYLEYLSTAIRLDLDENITDRTFFVLGGIGFYPRPNKKMLRKCLRYCHYNTLRFLDQLFLLFREEDQFKERVQNPKIPLKSQDLNAWNDRIIMACICHLEFPKLLREIMDRLPPLPKEKLLPPIPKPRYRKVSFKKYESPYDQPLWRERMNWIEERKLERINRARANMDRKRVKIPPLALVRRPSLIDARPPFLSQIEASQSFHRRKKPQKRIRPLWKKEKPTFDSKVDVTAIAGIEASEVSTIPKADSEEICMFLRNQEPKSESVPTMEEEDDIETEEEEEEREEQEHHTEPIPELKVKSAEEQSVKSVSLTEEDFVVEEDAADIEDDIPFITPPKNESGITIQDPCPPPKSSPGPPALHYDTAKRELGLVNEELCLFDPNENRSNDDEMLLQEKSLVNMNVEAQLMHVAKKLKELNIDEEEEEEEEEEKILKMREKNQRKKKKKRARKKVQSKGKKITSKDVTKLPAKEGGEPPYANEERDFRKSEVDLATEESNESCTCGQDKQKNKQRAERKTEKSHKKKHLKKKKRAKKHKLSPCKGELVGEMKPATSNVSKGVNDDVPNTKRFAFSKKEKYSTQEESPVDEEKVYHGDVLPLLKTILKDLNDEGFVSAGFEEIHKHPDIKQLIKYLQGEVVTESKKKDLYTSSRGLWRTLKKLGRMKTTIPDLNLSQKTMTTATWNDKKWISNLAKKKKEQFYFNIAKSRSNEAKNLYLTLFQEYFYTDRFLQSYYAYMVPTRNECIMRGFS